VIEPGGGAGLALEALAGKRGQGAVAGQELERDAAVEAGVLGQVDHSHPAITQLLEHVVLEDCLASHGEGSPYIGCWQGRMGAAVAREFVPRGSEEGAGKHASTVVC